MNREKLQAEALEDIRKIMALPKLSWPERRRRMSKVLIDLRAALGEKPGTVIVRTRKGPTVQEMRVKMEAMLAKQKRKREDT